MNNIMDIGQLISICTSIITLAFILFIIGFVIFYGRKQKKIKSILYEVRILEDGKVRILDLTAKIYEYEYDINLELKDIAEIEEDISIAEGYILNNTFYITKILN